jgi:hypothetical protein
MLDQKNHFTQSQIESGQGNGKCLVNPDRRGKIINTSKPT